MERGSGAPETDPDHGPDLDVTAGTSSEIERGDDVMWALVDAAPDALVMTAQDGRILLFNRQAEELFGYERGELLGRSVDELLPDRLRQVHGAHRTRYQAEPRTRAMGTGLVLFGRRKDGSEVPVEISLSPVETETGTRVVAAVRDITERIAGEARERRVRELLDATRDGVFIFDVDSLQFSYVNDGAVSQVGYDREQLLGMTPLHLTPEFAEVDFRDRLAPLRRGEVSSTLFTTVHRRNDGVDLPVEMLVQAPVGEGAAARSFVAIVRDVSDRVEAEERLQRAREDLRLLDERERIARDLHDSVIQRLFATGMSLQTALSVLDRTAPARARVERAVDDLDETIREIRQAIYGLQGQEIRRAGVRSELLRVLEEEQHAWRLESTVRLDGAIESVPDELAEHLVAVLRETLSNVGRHASATRVTVELKVDDELVELRVSDDGVGVADERGHGNGLGNLDRRAREVGGVFELRRRPEGGTTAVWRVPNPRG